MKKYIIILTAVAGTVATQATLVHHWNMNEGSGPIWNLVTGMNTSLETGVTWGYDNERGTFLIFSRATTAALNPGVVNPAPTAANASTWAFWFNRDNDFSDGAVMVGNRRDGTGVASSTTGPGLNFLKITPGNGIVFYQNSVADAHPYTTGEMASREWVHMAVARSGSNLTVYVNGAVNTVASLNLAPVTIEDLPFYIGGDYNSGKEHEFFDGKLDDVRIYDHELTQAEVAALIPEPGTLGLVAVFGGGILFIRRRFKT